MKECTVHFLPAEAGDCSVIEFDNKDCIIVDCGYKSTYQYELKPLLIRLRHKGCKVILLVVTHIDQDHIEGAIELIKDNGDARKPNIITIENIWFNGFFNTLFMEDVFNTHRRKVISGLQKRDMHLVKSQLEMQHKASEGYITASQSKSFEEICAVNHYRLNIQFDDRIIKRNCESEENTGSSIVINECVITVLSPNNILLHKLAHKLDIEMIKLFGKDYILTKNSTFAKFFELLMGLYLETDVIESDISSKEEKLENWIGTSSLAKMNEVNNASIVIGIEYKGQKLLYTGDSDSDNWSEMLEEYYDIIKISHHGTTKPNLSLLEHTKAGGVLISTNGGCRNKHPERELVSRLILNGNKNLYFNYDIELKYLLLGMQQQYKFRAIFNEKEITL